MPKMGVGGVTPVVPSSIVHADLVSRRAGAGRFVQRPPAHDLVGLPLGVLDGRDSYPSDRRALIDQAGQPDIVQTSCGSQRTGQYRRLVSGERRRHPSMGLGLVQPSTDGRSQQLDITEVRPNPFDRSPHGDNQNIVVSLHVVHMVARRP